jgi:crotonobetaine/carnitine-CoA ligase
VHDDNAVAVAGLEPEPRARREPLRDLDALNVGDFLEEAARAVPDAPFLIHKGGIVSYSELNRRVDDAARAWQGLGVRQGDRVVFMVENRPEFLEAWLGLAKIGGVLVALNTRWLAPEIEYFLGLTEPRFALVSERYGEMFGRAVGSGSTLEGVLELGDLSPHPPAPPPPSGSPVAGPRTPSDPRASARPAEDGRGGEDRLRTPLSQHGRGAGGEGTVAGSDLISFISTSGTTGRPKAVMQTHRNYVLTGEGYASWVELRPGERIYVCLPLFHINSQAYSVMGAIAARGSIVLVERFSASRFWTDMVTYGVNVFNYIGSMLAVLLKRDPTPEERQHAVRLTYGGPAFPGPVRREIEERFGLTLISGIGMSENTFGLIEPLHEERRSGSLGKPRQHSDPRIVNEARVVDGDGREVPPGEVGELIFRSPVLMQGYYRDPEQTAQTIRDGWLYTGDLVKRDEDGFFYFVDRKKDIIRVRGENVSSAEVEGVLSAHPAVQEAAVVGVPSDLTEEIIAAFVVPRPGEKPAAARLAVWCRARLADFKVPRYVWIVESLPKTETLRAEKPRLREMAEERLEACRQRAKNAYPLGHQP